MRYNVVRLHFHPYPKDLKERISAFIDSPTMDLLSELDIPIALEHVEAYREAMRLSKIPDESVDLVSMHGQTLWHSPGRFSLQIGNPDLVAVRTGKFVVSDFRRKDIAVGGEGAPITPHIDYCIFGRSGRTVALNNIGGISNVTLIHGDRVLAFDTGPGNALMDAVARKFFGLDYDPMGEIASKGSVKVDVAEEVLRGDRYVHVEPPKSTGKEYYNEDFLKRFAVDDPYDLMATVTYYTALTIAFSYENYVYTEAFPEIVYFSGGGTKNRTLMGFLKDMLGSKIVTFSETFSDFKEAIWFALLGSEFLRGNPSNIPSVTGASKRVVLGRLSTPF